MSKRTERPKPPDWRDWHVHGDGDSYSRTISREELEHFKRTGELPKVGALPD